MEKESNGNKLHLSRRDASILQNKYEKFLSKHFNGRFEENYVEIASE